MLERGTQVTFAGWPNCNMVIYTTQCVSAVTVAPSYSVFPKPSSVEMLMAYEFTHSGILENLTKITGVISYWI